MLSTKAFILHLVEFCFSCLCYNYFIIHIMSMYSIFFSVIAILNTNSPNQHSHPIFTISTFNLNLEKKYLDGKKNDLGRKNIYNEKSTIICVKIGIFLTFLNSTHCHILQRFHDLLIDWNTVDLHVNYTCVGLAIITQAIF